LLSLTYDDGDDRCGHWSGQRDLIVGCVRARVSVAIVTFDDVRPAADEDPRSWAVCDSVDDPKPGSRTPDPGSRIPYPGYEKPPGPERLNHGSLAMFPRGRSSQHSVWHQCSSGADVQAPTGASPQLPSPQTEQRHRCAGVVSRALNRGAVCRCPR